MTIWLQKSKETVIQVHLNNIRKTSLTRAVYFRSVHERSHCPKDGVRDWVGVASYIQYQERF